MSLNEFYEDSRDPFRYYLVISMAPAFKQVPGRFILKAEYAFLIKNKHGIGNGTQVKMRITHTIIIIQKEY
jgi:hypothetical protein